MAIPVCRPCRGAGSDSHDAIRHGRSARVQTNPQASPPTTPSRANKRVPRTIAPYSRGNLANSLGYARDVNIALHFGPLYHAGSLRVVRRPPITEHADFSVDISHSTDRAYFHSQECVADLGDMTRQDRSRLDAKPRTDLSDLVLFPDLSCPNRSCSLHKFTDITAYTQHRNPLGTLRDTYGADGTTG